MSNGERVVKWEPTLLDRLHPGDGAEQWSRTLIDAGVIVELDEHPRWDAVRRLRRAVDAMHRAEGALAEASHPVGIATGSVPPAVWIAMGGTALLVFAVADLLVAIAITAVLFGAVGMVGLWWFLGQRQARKRRLSAREEARAAAGREARSALEGLFAEDFIAITGRTRVECTPTLWRKARELSDANRRKDGEAAQRIREEMKALEARLRGE